MQGRLRTLLLASIGPMGDLMTAVTNHDVEFAQALVALARQHGMTGVSMEFRQNFDLAQTTAATVANGSPGPRGGTEQERTSNSVPRLRRRFRKLRR
jgi:hypothetical protein